MENGHKMVVKQKTRWPLAVLFGVIGMILDSSYSAAQQQPSDGMDSKTAEKALQYIRQVSDARGEPKSLQTSITRFENADGVSVDLIGAVHIGNAQYYQVLNKVFEDYDVVLYELVAPEGQNVPTPGRKSSNPISFLQSSAQRMLNLSSQLEGIDYSKSNFVHADLSPQQMQQKMAERGETTFSLAMDAFSAVMQKQQSAQQTFGGNADEEMSFRELLEAFNNPYKLRRMMAAQFANENLEIGLGKSLNRLLVIDRNEAAMKVLDSELSKGHKKVAIFYGAAHMPDFQQRLEAHKFKATGQSWLDAWDLRNTAADEKGSQLSPLMKILEELGK